MSAPTLSDATLDVALQAAEAAIHAVRLERPNANDGKLAYVALKAALPVWTEVSKLAREEALSEAANHLDRLGHFYAADRVRALRGES
jgi:hypothetical protein